MEKNKRGRGRPKIDTGLVASLELSRRASVNMKYMYDGVALLSAAASEIPDGDLLWHSDDAACTADGKNGILEQLGRMVEQDHLRPSDCIFFANSAINAVKQGYTSRQIEKALRAVRMAIKKSRASPDDEILRLGIQRTINQLVRMQ